MQLELFVPTLGFFGAPISVSFLFRESLTCLCSPRPSCRPEPWLCRGRCKPSCRRGSIFCMAACCRLGKVRREAQIAVKEKQFQAVQCMLPTFVMFV